MREVTSIAATSAGNTTPFTWLGGQLSASAYGTFSSATITLQMGLSSTAFVAVSTGITSAGEIFVEGVPVGALLRWNVTGGTTVGATVTAIVANC
jgi:hypothetical protein